MSNGSGPEQIVPRSRIAPLPETGEIVWSDVDIKAPRWLDDYQVVQESLDEWGTPTYGQLAVDLAGFERGMLACTSLIGELDEAGHVINSGWNHWRLSDDFPAEPLSFEEVVERAAMALRDQHFLSPMQLRAGNLSMPGERAKLLDIVPLPLTYESVRHAVQAKVHPPHGAFGKAYDTLAMAVDLRNMPLEHNRDLFVPDNNGWISQRNLMHLAPDVVSAQKIRTMRDKIVQLLGEQVETGAPMPAGEVVIEGACALKVSRAGAPKVSYDYISRDSFLPVFAEYSVDSDRDYANTRAFCERLAGRPIDVDNRGISGFERRRRRVTFILDQTI